MAAITAALVKELRDRTGLGMMECKKALTETDGDIEVAIDNLRKSGATKAAKKSANIAAEGAVHFAITPDSKTALILEVNSQTDFVARDANFTAFAKQVAEVALAAGVTDVAAIAGLAYGNGQTIEEARIDLVQKIGENIQVRRAQLIEGALLGTYTHGLKIGVVVALAGGSEDLAKDVAMHIAASKPEAITPEDVNPALVAKEREIAEAKAAESGKPANIVEKMVEGAVKKYLTEVSLVEQAFVKDPEKRANLLFVNQGNDANGIPQFEELAAAYGIADTTHSANAQFFDCDNDGDLDLFLAVNLIDKPNPNQYFKKATDGSSPNRDRLYRNDWVAKVGHPVFTDISLEAGLKWDGYSHSSLVSDFNEDGWPDIYVANDYVTNDLIYLRDSATSAYTNQIARIFKHQAASAMGSDVADINNDGWSDLFALDMLPFTNERKKLFLPANNYSKYLNNEKHEKLTISKFRNLC